MKKSRITLIIAILIILTAIYISIPINYPTTIETADKDQVEEQVSIIDTSIVTLISDYNAIEVREESFLDTTAFLPPMLTAKLQEAFVNTGGRPIYANVTLDDIKKIDSGYEICFINPVFDIDYHEIRFELICDEKLGTELLSRENLDEWDQYGIIAKIGDINKIQFSVNMHPIYPYDYISNEMNIETSNHWICTGTLIDYIIIED